MEADSSGKSPVPLPMGDLEAHDIVGIVEKISLLLSEEIGPNARIHNYLNEVKNKAGGRSGALLNEELRELILKHPYFKNPCKHPIRIISIMKYLKKKGYAYTPGLENRVDSILASLDGVKRIEFGRYKKNGA